MTKTRPLFSLLSTIASVQSARLTRVKAKEDVGASVFRPPWVPGVVCQPLNKKNAKVRTEKGCEHGASRAPEG
ncbi:hypothetical protein BR93DRAFT_931742 [Coniochaeta sp. PMI_546]|nr:hypothetical protein BR93DRAFT_931742 [Coniochaeta sp. PMI_546]